MSVLMSDDFILDAEQYDEFRMWQGLVGPYYTPSVDGAGNLSWTNNGGLANPEAVNIQGRGLTIVGIVEDASDLPQTADDYVTYLVGEEAPYEGYIYDNGTWVDLGIVGRGEQGEPGFSPVVTVSPITGGHQISITDAENTETFNVMDGADGQDGADGVGVPSGGTTGQVLKKASGTNYDTEWGSAGEPATANPLMDGTAAVGTSTKYSREDHVHPTDTSRASATDLSTLSGSFKAFTITLLSNQWLDTGNGIEQTVTSPEFFASGYAYIVSPASASFTDYCAAQIHADDAGNNSMVFYCEDAPTVNLTVNIARVVAT